MDQANWYAVYTKAGREEQAGENLDRQRITSYVPLARFSDRSRKHYTTRPLFTRYIFALALPDQLHLFKNTKGVSHLVSFAGEPAVIDRGIIYDLKNLHDEDGFIKLEKEKRREYEALKKGDRVRVEWGPFAGLFGVVEYLLGPEKVRLLAAFTSDGQGVAHQFALTMPRSDITLYSPDMAL